METQSTQANIIRPDVSCLSIECWDWNLDQWRVLETGMYALGQLARDTRRAFAVEGIEVTQ